jgi:hypothetical protein
MPIQSRENARVDAIAEKEGRSRCVSERRRLLLGLEVVEEDAALLGFLTPVTDDDARAVDDLAGVTLTVDLACTLY